MQEASHHLAETSTFLTTFERLPLQVLREICFTLIRPSGRKSYCSEGEPTLLALAVTSRTLSQPALDVIWYKIPHLVVLLCTIREKCHKVKKIFEARSDRQRILFVGLFSVYITFEN